MFRIGRSAVVFAGLRRGNNHKAMTRIIPALAGVLVIFALDLLVPLGYVVWIGYGFPLWYVSRVSSSQHRWLPAVAGLCTGLIVVGWVAQLDATASWTSLVNRLLGVSVLWVMTVVLMRSRAADDRLAAAHGRLRQSEEEFRLMADAAPVLIWISGADRRRTFFNRRWFEFTGRTMEQELGNGWSAGMHPEDAVRCLETYGDAFERKAPFELEYRLRRFDGEYRWIIDRGVPRRSPGAEFLGYVGSCLDVTDLKRSQEAAKESESRLRGIISSAMDAIVTVNEAQRITDFNAAAEQMFRCDAAAALGEPIDRFIPGRFRSVHAHHIEAFGRTQVTKRQMGALGTIYGLRADGEEFPIEASISQLRNRSGKFYTVILRDVTERLQAEKALYESERRFRELAESLPQLVWTSRADGRWDYLGPQWEAYTGKSEQALLAEGWESCLHPEERDEARAGWARAVSSGTPFEADVRIRRADGRYRWFHAMASPVRDDEGRATRWFGTGLDIDDRKQWEDAQARMAAIVESSDDAIIGMSLDGIVVSWNGSAHRMYGYTAEEVLGKPVTMLYLRDRYDEEARIIERIKAGERVEHYETVRRRKDGTQFFVSLTISPIRNGAGVLTGLSKIARDITEQKRAEEDLRERDRALTEVNEALKIQTAALAAANKELEGFSYSVSHDLRAPLRTIDAFSRIAVDDHGAGMDPEVGRCLAIVRKAAAQAGELIDDLLEFSRLGRQAMQVRPVQMTQLVHEAVGDLQGMREGRKLDLVVNELPPCLGDRRLLKLVWTNLLSNALKYTRHADEARIEVGSKPGGEDDEVAYFVKDNGVGFDMRYVHKLFGVFQRLHRKEEFEGTGVGLAIVQRIVHRHGGRVWAEGKINGGAEFSFSLRKAAA